jgi:hypothetical protein
MVDTKKKKKNKNINMIGMSTMGENLLLKFLPKSRPRESSKTNCNG